MPTDIRNVATKVKQVVPPKTPSVNVQNADPSVQRTLAQHAETINAILTYLNKILTT